MSVICPTILALDPHGYREQMERIEGFAKRVQVDLADGIFAKNKTVTPPQLYWDKHLVVDLHIMYENPAEQLDTLIALKPHMVIVHAECRSDIGEIFSRLEEMGVKKGLALLPDTKPSDHQELIKRADHVLIFAGSLGFFGGEADLLMLEKVDEILEINSEVELGWDGGANDKNIRQLIHDGIDVINVGNFIQRAHNPQDAYAIMNQIATEAN